MFLKIPQEGQDPPKILLGCLTNKTCTILLKCERIHVSQDNVQRCRGNISSTSKNTAKFYVDSVCMRANLVLIAKKKNRMKINKKKVSRGACSNLKTGVHDCRIVGNYMVLRYSKKCPCIAPPIRACVNGSAFPSCHNH